MVLLYAVDKKRSMTALVVFVVCFACRWFVFHKRCQYIPLKSSVKSFWSSFVFTIVYYRRHGRLISELSQILEPNVQNKSLTVVLFLSSCLFRLFLLLSVIVNESQESSLFVGCFLSLLKKRISELLEIFQYCIISLKTWTNMQDIFFLHGWHFILM